MSQATGSRRSRRAYKAFHDPYYLHWPIGARDLHAAPPAGVAVATPLGARYVQYTFAPSTSIINAFLQSLIGLYDYAKVSGDAEALGLFTAGDAEAQAEVPAFDTGAWSLYQPGHRGHPLLPRAGHRFPPPAVHEDEAAGLLHGPRRISVPT